MGIKFSGSGNNGYRPTSSDVVGKNAEKNDNLSSSHVILLPAILDTTHKWAGVFRSKLDALSKEPEHLYPPYFPTHQEK